MVRAGFGIGGGSAGLGGRLGIEGEWWSFDHVGFGARASLFTSGQLFGDRSAGARAIAATVALRTASSGPYGLLEFGFGYAHVDQTRGGCTSLRVIGPPCPPVTHQSFDTVYASASLGALFHMGRTELGPLLQAEVTPRAMAVTLGVYVGAGL